MQTKVDSNLEVTRTIGSPIVCSQDAIFELWLSICLHKMTSSKILLVFTFHYRLQNVFNVRLFQQIIKASRTFEWIKINIWHVLVPYTHSNIDFLELRTSKDIYTPKIDEILYGHLRYSTCKLRIWMVYVPFKLFKF